MQFERSRGYDVAEEAGGVGCMIRSRGNKNVRYEGSEDGF